MKTVTTRVDSDTLEEIADRAEESDQSKSAVARQLIQQGLEYEDVKTERDRLQRKLTESNSQRDDVDDLVAFVEDEQVRRQRERERQERREEAPAWRRAKWWLLGRPSRDDVSASASADEGDV